MHSMHSLCCAANSHASLLVGFLELLRTTLLVSEQLCSMHIRSLALGRQHVPSRLTQHQDHLDVQDHQAQFVHVTMLGKRGVV